MPPENLEVQPITIADGHLSPPTHLAGISQNNARWSNSPFNDWKHGVIECDT